MRPFTTLAVIVALLATLALAAAFWLSHQITAPGPLSAAATVTIPAGSSTRAMGNLLAAQGVIRHAWLFEGAVRAYGLTPKLQAGQYAFTPGLSLNAVITKLAEGHTVLGSITLPEGLTVRQSLKLLEANPNLTGPARPIPAEGYLFPDTYHFAPGTKRAEILTEARKRAETELAAAWQQRHPGTPYKTPEDLLIMASIIEKEAAHTAEMPTIAAVFTNRLHKNMKLQADPTVIYGAELDGNNLKTKDMREAQPFNTYTNFGLPPTAIANPGKAALLAAAQPAASPALFFVAKPDRSGHVFTETYAEHNKAVKAYWNAQRKVVSAKSATTPIIAAVSNTAPSSSTATSAPLP